MSSPSPAAARAAADRRRRSRRRRPGRPPAPPRPPRRHLRDRGPVRPVARVCWRPSAIGTGCRRRTRDSGRVEDAPRRGVDRRPPRPDLGLARCGRAGRARARDPGPVREAARLHPRRGRRARRVAERRPAPARLHEGLRSGRRRGRPDQRRRRRPASAPLRAIEVTVLHPTSESQLGFAHLLSAPSHFKAGGTSPLRGGDRRARPAGDRAGGGGRARPALRRHPPRRASSTSCP